MCAILEKTSDWFNINNKPNFFIPEQEILPVDDYSFTDEEEKLDLVFQVKTKKPKVKSDNPYNEEMKKKMMGYIDGVIKDIEARKNLNKGLEEAYLEVETQKRLINNVECTSELI